MVRDTGFEPVTPSVSGRCSTTELTAQVDGLVGGAVLDTRLRLGNPFFRIFQVFNG